VVRLVPKQFSLGCIHVIPNHARFFYGGAHSDQILNKNAIERPIKGGDQQLRQCGKGIETFASARAEDRSHCITAMWKLLDPESAVTRARYVGDDNAK